MPAVAGDPSKPPDKLPLIAKLSAVTMSHQAESNEQRQMRVKNLADTQEILFERGYDPSVETLKPAGSQAQEQWKFEKQKLVEADARLDHTIGSQIPTYKDAVANLKL